MALSPSLDPARRRPPTLDELLRPQRPSGAAPNSPNFLGVPFLPAPFDLLASLAKSKGGAAAPKGKATKSGGKSASTGQGATSRRGASNRGAPPYDIGEVFRISREALSHPSSPAFTTTPTGEPIPSENVSRPLPSRAVAPRLRRSPTGNVDIGTVYDLSRGDAPPPLSHGERVARNLSKLPFHPIVLDGAIRHGGRSLETLRANPNLSAGSDLADNLESAASAGIFGPAGSWFADTRRENRMRGQGPNETISTRDAALATGRAMGLDPTRSLRILDPTSAEYRLYKASVSHGRGLSEVQDDGVAKTLAAGGSRVDAAIGLAIPDLGSHSDGRLYGDAFGASMSPFSALRHMLGGDLRRAEDRPWYEQTGDVLGDNAALVLTGSAGARAAEGVARWGAKEGAGVLAKVAGRLAVSRPAATLGGKALQRGVSTFADNAGLQGPAILGRADDLSRERGGSLASGVPQATFESAKGFVESLDVRRLFDPHVSAGEKTQTLFLLGSFALGAAQARGAKTDATAIKILKVRKGVSDAVAQAALAEARARLKGEATSAATLRFLAKWQPEATGSATDRVWDDLRSRAGSGVEVAKQTLLQPGSVKGMVRAGEASLPRPYGEMKRGVNVKVSGAPDFSPFVRNGRLFATLIRGDRTGVHDFVHPDGTVTPQHGGPDNAWLPGSEGFVWTSKGKPVDTRIHASLEKTGGLAIVRIGAEDQSHSSGASRVYAGAIRAARSLGLTSESAVVDHLRDAFRKVGVKEEYLKDLDFEKALGMLEAKGFVKYGNQANFPASKKVVEHLALPRVSSSLGIPDRASMLAGINARRFQGLPNESVVSAFFGDPYTRVSPKRGERGWHPDYDHAVRGIHLGDLRTPPTLAELAPGELRRWMRDERQAYLNFLSLPSTEQAKVIGRLRKGGSKEGKRARRSIAAEYGLLDLRIADPKVNDWYSSLRDSNRVFELSLVALLRSMGQ